MSRDAAYYSLEPFVEPFDPASNTAGEESIAIPKEEIEIDDRPGVDSVLYRYFSPILIFALTIFAGIFLAASSSTSFVLYHKKFASTSGDDRVYTFYSDISAIPTAGSLFTSQSGEIVIFSDQDGYIYRSEDYGNRFTSSRALEASDGTYGQILGLVMTESGKKMVVGAGAQGTFYSSDYGKSWSLQSEQECSILASTRENLERLACIGGPTTQDNYLYYSTDRGATFAQSNDDEARDWVGIVGNPASGALLAVVGSGYNYTFRSFDDGENWIQSSQDESMKWGCLASSADGNMIILTDSVTRNIHMSQDQGVTWVQAYNSKHDSLASDTDILSCAVSGDGVYFALGFSDVAIKVTTNCTTAINDCAYDWSSEDSCSSTGTFNTTAIALNNDGSYLFSLDSSNYELSIGKQDNL